MFGLEDLNNTSTTGLVGLDFTVPSFEDDSSTVFILRTLTEIGGFSNELLSSMVCSRLKLSFGNVCLITLVVCTSLQKPVGNLLNINHGVDVPLSTIRATIRKEQYIIVTSLLGLLQFCVISLVVVS